jgi:flavin-binding protein dodecin
MIVADGCTAVLAQGWPHKGRTKVRPYLRRFPASRSLHQAGAAPFAPSAPAPVPIPQEVGMSVARVSEIQSSSRKSFQDALEQGIKRANKTLRNVSGAWIKDERVVIEKGKITEYRILMKVTFVLDD